MPKCKTSKKFRERVEIDDFNEVCQESDNFIELAENELLTTMSMLGNEKTIHAFEWQNKCQRYMSTVRNFLKKYHLSTSQKSRCLNLIRKIDHLRCHFDAIMKRGAGLNQSDERIKWVNTEEAFDRRLQTGTIINLTHIDINEFLDDAFALFEERIRICLNRYGPLKVYTVLGAKFKKVLNDGKEDFDFKTFIATTKEILLSTPLDEWYNNNVKQLTLKMIEEFQGKDSNWQLHSIHRLEVNINKYSPMRASFFIELPTAIKQKRACINVQNADNQCFKWAVLSALYPPVQHSERVSKYRQYEDMLDFTGIEFPFALKDIAKFESLNNISINVYGLSRRNNAFTVSPLHLTVEKRKRHVNLLRIEDHYIDENVEEEEEEEFIMPFNYHYVCIKDLSMLVSTQLSNHNGKKYICDRCLHYFRDEQKLLEHEETCRKMNDTKIILPKPDKNILEFKHFVNEERVPFIIYADCESLLIPSERPQEPSSTEVFQNHKLLSIGYYLNCGFDDSLSAYNASPKDEENPAK